MNKRFISISTIIIFCSLFAKAQDFSPISNLLEFQDLFTKKSNEISSLKSNFVQEKSISMLEQKMISYGSFKYKKEAKLRMEYTKPFYYLLAINGEKVTIKNNAKQTTSSGSNRLFKMISQITIDCFNGNILKSKQFNVSVFENNTSFKLILYPKMKDLNSILSEIILIISKQTYTVSTLEMKERSGDSSLMTFTNTEINTPIDDETFIEK